MYKLNNFIFVFVINLIQNYLFNVENNKLHVINN